MKKINLPKQKISPNFIGSWVMEPLSICDELITYFEANQNKQIRGVTAGGEKLHVKDSTDIKITPKDVKLPGNEVFERYFQNLFILYKDYVNDWPFLKTFAENLHVDSFNLQRYERGQHFQHTHTERSGLETIHRIFAWMTYLNDVDVQDGGSTFFTHYDLKVQPKKGLTLIWPSELTHAHRGDLLNANSKYIITGWMHFPQ